MAARFVRFGEQVEEDERGRVTVEVYRASGLNSQAEVLAHPEAPKYLQNEQGRVCIGVSADRIKEGIDHWELEARWLDVSFLPPGAVTVVRRAIERKLLPVRVWRIPSNDNALEFPSNKSSPGQQDADDIGGLAVDVQAEPVDHIIHAHEISIEVKIPAPVPELLYDAIQGTRNDRPWHGYPNGKVLFNGAANGDTESDGRVWVRHSFVVDGWWHLRQRPHCVSNGDVIKYGGGQIFLTWLRAGQAKTVVWYQPFPLTTNFAALGIP